MKPSEMVDLQRYRDLHTFLDRAKYNVDVMEQEFGLDHKAAKFYHQLVIEWKIQQPGYRPAQYSGATLSRETFHCDIYWGGEDDTTEEFPIEMLFVSDEERDTWIAGYVTKCRAENAAKKELEDRLYKERRDAEARQQYEKLKQRFEPTGE